MCQQLTATDSSAMKQRPKLKYISRGVYDPHSKNSDDESDSIILTTKKSNKSQNVEVDVQSGDTLQAIALRFNCNVATLKAANNIHKENEIFAKGKLKIPVTAFSLLTESLPAVHTSGNNSPTKSKELRGVKQPALSNDIDLQQKLIVASVNSAEVSPPLRLYPENNANSSSRPDNRYIISDISDSEICENDARVPLMPNTIIKKNVENAVIEEFTTKGADLGIKWYHLAICGLLVVLIVPLIYVFYIAEHPEKYQHHHIKSPVLSGNRTL